MSNQGAWNDIIEVEQASTSKVSREIEPRETHFCSLAAVESGSNSPDALLEEHCSSFEKHDSQDAISSVHSLHDGVDLVLACDAQPNPVSGMVSHASCRLCTKLFASQTCFDQRSKRK